MMLMLSQAQFDALGYLSRVREQRKKYASLVRQARKNISDMCKETGKPHRYFSKAWRKAMLSIAKTEFGSYYPTKLSKKNIKLAIANLTESTAAPLSEIILDDGYACCGLEDHEADYREHQLAQLALYKECLNILEVGK